MRGVQRRAPVGLHFAGQNGGDDMRHPIRTVISQMISYEQGEPQRVHHFLKVHAFAHVIGESECLSEDVYKRQVKDYSRTEPVCQPIIRTLLRKFEKKPNNGKSAGEKQAAIAGCFRSAAVRQPGL